MSVVISIVGHSNSGKTTLLESLISELRRRGYNPATIKHVASDFDLDHPGKDSWRLAKAGSGAVVLSSPQRIALIKPVDREAILEELLYLIGGDFDLILTEGFKSSNTHKIEVHRKDLGGLVCSPEELFALVTDEPLDIAIPQFFTGEIELLANLVEKEFLALREAEETFLIMNDTPIYLNPFAKSIIHKTLMGMVSALRGAEEVRSLQISLRRGQV